VGRLRHRKIRSKEEAGGLKMNKGLLGIAGQRKGGKDLVLRSNKEGIDITVLGCRKKWEEYMRGGDFIKRRGHSTSDKIIDLKVI